MRCSSFARVASVVLALWASPCAAQTCYIQPLPWITDFYGSTEGRSNPHRGTDYDGPGLPDIPSVADGQVVHVESWGDTAASECLGNFVEIRHPDGMYTTYCHLRAVYVGVGQYVSRGQAIGQMGDTGTPEICVQGAHLHLVMATRSGRYFGGYWADGTTDAQAYIAARSVCRPDRDGDGSYEGDDCDDGDARRAPGRAESCDAIDNDCDARIDENVSRVCGTDVGECRAGVATCTTGAWGACVGEIPAVDETCNTRDDDCDAIADDERVCEHDDATLARTIASGASDVDGDGRADACMRTPAGFTCLVSGAHGFARAVRGPTMASEDGWSEPAIYSSVRMGDVDGDGRSDLCARSGDRFACWSATGVDFDDGAVSLPIGAPSPGARSAEVWLADVDGDGLEDPCARDAGGLRCLPSAGGGLRTLRALSDAEGWDDVGRHGSIRFGDVDGDGRDDVCARDAEGLRCWRAGTESFGEAIVGPRWSDADGWSEPRYGSTIRLADVDGDGDADACGRGPDGFVCWLADGRGFGVSARGPSMRGEAWDARSSYATIRMGDVDGDGAADVCARSADGVRCWLWTGSDFGREVVGPPLGDAEGWSDAARYTTLRLADVDGDGRADVCARTVDGVRCWISEGTSFSHVWASTAWGDVAGLTDAEFASSLTIASTASDPTAPGASASCACTASGATGGGRSACGLACVAALLFTARRRMR